VRKPSALDLGVPFVVLLLLAAPALFTRSGFIDDWVNHLWLTWLQSREISATGHPSLFINVEPLGVFYPNFAFYGGTLYALGGYLMAMTGAPVAVFVALIVLSFVACYAGTLWVARQAGVTGTTAHLPAMIVVTGAYYLSLAYGRGSWPEFVATSMIPLLAALALHIVRRGATPGPILALGAVTAIWSGSHNLTFALGTVFLSALGVVIVVAWFSALTERHVRRIGLVVGVALLGVMVNGWFLLPDLAYSLHTQIAQYRTLDPAVSSLFNRLPVVLDPFRERATHSSYLRAHFTELPSLVIGWLLVATAMTWRDWTRRLRWLVALLTVVAAVPCLLLVDESVWTKLPSNLSLIQFTFRLETYIVATLAGLTIAVLLGVRRLEDRRRRRGLTLTLAAIVLLGVGLGTWQVWNSDAYYYSPRYLTDRSLVLHYPHTTPPTWYETGQFRDVGDQVVPTDGSVRLNPAAVKGESTTQTVVIPPGEGPLGSNIAASANLVSVHGLRIAGRTTDGFLALERPRDGARTATVTVERADTAPMQAGPLVTLFGALGLLFAAISCAIHRRGHSVGGPLGSA
jgi:hypothetical protein